MERSISSLIFRGSISEAILEAKNSKKLFVVYIAGEDDESARLENSTWTDPKVAETVSKYCVLLHKSEGSTDAVQFSAIYPQNSVPSITAIGYNGIKLWQNDGFVDGEVLATGLEKAWLGLHIQETTATFLTAALAPKKAESSDSGSSVASSSDQENPSSIRPGASVFPSSDQGSSSSISVIPSASAENDLEFSKVRALDTPELEKSESREFNVKKISEDQQSMGTSDAKMSDGGNEQSSHFSGCDKVLPTPVNDSNSSRKDHKPSQTERSSPQPEIINDQPSVPGSPGVAALELNEHALNKKDGASDDSKTQAVDNSTRVNESNDIFLSIRLPNGVGLREKFSMTSTLSMVKDCVDRQHASSSGSYDIAIPYPRRVFTDQDLSKSLSELGLLDRQSLIVVPRRSTHEPVGSSSSDLTDSGSDTDDETESEGYFSYVKKFISFLNPFSYVDGATSSSSGQESESSTWQYGPNTVHDNNSGRIGRPDSPYLQSPITSSDRRNIGNTGRLAARYGSNIHTLKHDEDDDHFRDRNAFWNGNSTQYGGDSDQR